MSQSRRQFLRDVAAVAAAASVPAAARAQPSPTTTTPPPPPPTAAPVPTVIATWDYGLELVTAAARALAGGRSLLDALEAGVNVVEDDPKVTTVGFGDRKSVV